jgi:hypothetical protein
MNQEKKLVLVRYLQLFLDDLEKYYNEDKKLEPDTIRIRQQSIKEFKKFVEEI